MSTTARTTTGDLALPRVIVTDPAQVALQTIVDGLALWQGEWFLDTNAGFPWAQRVFGVKNPNSTQIQALLRQFLLSVPSVVSVVASAFIDRVKRQFAYTFSATLNTGQTITGGSATPFQVTGAP